MSPNRPHQVSLSKKDYQSEHAAEVLHRCARHMESSLREQGTESGFLDHILEGIRKGLKCGGHILAGCAKGTLSNNSKIIREYGRSAQTGDKWLQMVWSQTLESKDGTWGKYLPDLKSGQVVPKEVKVISACLDISLVHPKHLIRLSNNRESLVTLLFAVFHPQGDPPDPDYPESSFLTYDQDWLRVTILQVAAYLQHQHQSSVTVYEKCMHLAGLETRSEAARKLIEFEVSIGLFPDVEVMKNWLSDETKAFAAGESQENDFEKVLESATNYLTKTAVTVDVSSVRQLLFEGYLCLLSKGEMASSLLSERIAAARKEAKWPVTTPTTAVS